MSDSGLFLCGSCTCFVLVPAVILIALSFATLEPKRATPHALTLLPIRVKLRSAKVSKTLLAVSEMVDAGHRVIFDRVGDKDVSRAEHKETGEITPLTRRDRVYEMDWQIYPYEAFQRPSNQSS